MIVSAEIEGVHVLPLVSCDLPEKFQHFINTFNCQCGDNDILKIISLNYFLNVIKCVNEEEKYRGR